MPDVRHLSFADAVSEGLAESMARDPAVFMIGEGIADPSAVFGTTRGLLERFGKERMVEMPVAENGMTGVAIGSAMMGQRPVMSLHRVEFSLLALEQIVNTAAKMHYVSNGRHTVPLVIRMVVGRGWGQGPQHSQSLEPIFAYFPGLKVIMPARPSDAKGMLIAAVEDQNPIIIIEHRWLHYVTGPVPEGYTPEPLDGPRVVHQGKDVTIVATSYSVIESIAAAEALAEADISAEVIDLRVLRPLELEPIRKSVAKTGRLITVDTGWITYGIGAEIVAGITETAFDTLKAAPRRLGLADHPTPSSRGLVGEYYPTPEKVVEQVGSLLNLGSDRLAPARDRLREWRGDVPIDVPNSAFRGPF